MNMPGVIEVSAKALEWAEKRAIGRHCRVRSDRLAADGHDLGESGQAENAPNMIRVISLALSEPGNGCG